jgi:cell division protein ZapB
VHASIIPDTKVDIETLEQRIDELISLCDELERKHTAMETDREKWLQERTRLLEKNEMAKSKIEAMIMRLKSLEQD